MEVKLQVGTGRAAHVGASTSRSYTRYRSRAGGQQRGLATLSSMNGWIGMSSFSIWPGGGGRSDI